MDVRDPAELDDAALIERCRAGQPRAWELLVRRYQRLVYTIVRRVGLDEHLAADVFQTVFTRLLEHLPRIVDASRLQAWIVTTAKREALLQRRRGARTESMSRATDDDGEGGAWEVADEAALPEDALAEIQALEHLRRSLERLDERCRELLMLLFRDEDERLPYDEVARRVGVPVGSIGPTRQRCLGKLRKLAT